MRFRFAVVLLAVTPLACMSYLKPLPLTVRPPPASGPAMSADAKAARLTTIVIDVPLGHRYGEFAWGFTGSCTNKRSSVNTAGTFDLESDVYATEFARVLGDRGFPVEQGLELFKNSKERVADLLVAARIVDATLNQCAPKWGANENLRQGEAHLKIEWSVFSSLEKKVVYKTATEGSTHGWIATEVGEKGIFVAAFREAAAYLAIDPGFREVVEARPAKQEEPGGAVGAIRIARVAEWTGGLQGRLDSIRKGVVTVTANRGSGSGFVVSADGLVITAEHVVSGSRWVKAVLVGGKECYGEVAASSRKRDLALIRLDCGGLVALPLSIEQPEQGTPVFAVGTPLSEKLEFSVTRGIVSGYREVEGISYIQSDVTILPGSSGGPLLDESGNVVGVTSVMVSKGGAPVGVNFFIPIGDLTKDLPLRLE